MPRELRFEVAGRLDGDGDEIEPWDGVRAGDSRPTSTPSRCACCTPTATPGPKRRSPRRCARGGYDVTASSEVSPEFREYERMVTTVVNAYLRPACAPYLARLADLAARCW